MVVRKFVYKIVFFKGSFAEGGKLLGMFGVPHGHFNIKGMANLLQAVEQRAVHIFAAAGDGEVLLVFFFDIKRSPDRKQFTFPFPVKNAAKAAAVFGFSIQ
jgi:hypothetical protein